VRTETVLELGKPLQQHARQMLVLPQQLPQLRLDPFGRALDLSQAPSLVVSLDDVRHLETPFRSHDVR
jgi:hypothetical protein